MKTEIGLSRDIIHRNVILKKHEDQKLTELKESPLPSDHFDNLPIGDRLDYLKRLETEIYSRSLIYAKRGGVDPVEEAELSRLIIRLASLSA